MPAPDVEALLARLRVTRVDQFKMDIGRGIFEADPRIPGDVEAMHSTIEKLGLNGPNAPAIIAAIRGAGSLSQDEVPLELASRRWSDVAEEYLVDLFQRTLNRKTQADFRGILTRFQGVVGDKAIGSVTVADVSSFVAREVADGLKPKTQRKHLATVHTLLRFAQSRAYFPPGQRLPTASILEQAKRQPAKKTKRLAFTTEDLTRIFEEKSYIEWNGHRANTFWLPLLALFTGARLEEMCQTRCCDIKCDGRTGIWYIDFNEHYGKTLKNEASCRLVPIHETLIKLGFLTYHDAIASAGFKDDYLFPFLSQSRYGDRSDTSSKHFGRFLRGIGITDPRKVQHSFRHTVATGLRGAGVRTDVAHRLLGHALNDGEHATYLHTDMPLATLYSEGIARLMYDGLELGHLRCDSTLIGAWKTRLTREALMVG